MSQHNCWDIVIFSVLVKTWSFLSIYFTDNHCTSMFIAILKCPSPGLKLHDCSTCYCYLSPNSQVSSGKWKLSHILPLMSSIDFPNKKLNSPFKDKYSNEYSIQTVCLLTICHNWYTEVQNKTFLNIKWYGKLPFIEDVIKEWIE